MEKDARIYVAGAHKLKGAAIVRELSRQGFGSVIGADCEPELEDAAAVDRFFLNYRPEYVFVAAGRAAGIAGNQRYPADLIRNNLLVAVHVLDGAYRHHVKKLIYLGSSCLYPRNCMQPMGVESILTGSLEPTNEAYAIAKIAGLKMCEAYRKQYGARFITAIPADAFGPEDNFNLEDSHVVAALIRRMHEAKLAAASHIDIWGSGNQRREFIFADDLADACIFSMQHYDGAQPINLGGGADLSIRELASHIRDAVGFAGELRFDASKPDGMPLKALDSSRLFELGWRRRTQFALALQQTYQWFLEHQAAAMTCATPH